MGDVRHAMPMAHSMAPVSAAGEHRVVLSPHIFWTLRDIEKKHFIYEGALT